MAIQKYSKKDVLIVFKWFNKNRKYIKYKNMYITLGSVAKIFGIIWLKNDFVDFKSEEIKIIAYSGYIAQLVYGLLISIFYIVLVKNPIPYLEFVNALTFSLIITMMSCFSKTDRWIDGKIIRYPKQFKKFMMKLDDNDILRYQNALKKHVGNKS